MHTDQNVTRRLRAIHSADVKVLTIDNSRRFKMKSLLIICLMLLIASCAPVPLAPGPAFWQYDDDKFVTFNEQVKMTWDYGNDKIDCFEIDREVVKLKNADINKITKFVKDKNKKELIEIANKYREQIIWKEDAIKYPSKDEREFIDIEEPLPKFKRIYFYQLLAVDKCGPKETDLTKSDPTELSVIIIRRPK
jgi:hypothetical protein